MDHKDKSGETVIMKASKVGSVDIVVHLLEAGMMKHMHVHVHHTVRSLNADLNTR